MICLNCGRKIKSATSREASYGPVCYKRLFGSKLKSGNKASLSSAETEINYDIPGQMSLDDYLHMR